MQRFLILIVVTMMLASVSYADDEFGSRFIYQDYSKKISMDFKNASLIDVLKIYSKQSGKNFIAATELADKKVTLFFENIPLEDALNKILDANDLTYETKEDSDIFIVKVKENPNAKIITRIFPLQYATVSTSALNSASSSSSSSSSTSASSGSSPLTTAIQAAMSADGIIVEDPRTNSLIIKDKTEQFPLIEKAIADIDVPVPEILIELEMMDISKTTSEELGIKYGTEPLTFKGGERDVIYPFKQGMLLDKGYSFEEPEYRVGTVSAAGMTAALNFIRTRGDTKNLAKPRILTLNNRTAEIKISTNEAIGVSTTSDTTSTTGSTTKEAERVETGVFLTVTPQANIETREILLSVNPKVIQARDGLIIDSVQYKDPEERGTLSLLKVQDGETVVIGGLLREDKSTSISKLPILGDLPLIGTLFRHKSDRSAQRELIIFITPHIIDAKDYSKGKKSKKETEKMKKIRQSLNSQESGG